MIIDVRVNLRSGRALIKNEGSSFKAYLTRPAVEGQANRQLLELLAEHLGVKKYRLRIVKGENSRNKSVEIIDD